MPQATAGSRGINDDDLKGVEQYYCVQFGQESASVYLLERSSKLSIYFQNIPVQI